MKKKVNPQDDDAAGRREKKRSRRLISARDYRRRVKLQLDDKPLSRVLELKYHVGKVLDSMTMKGITLRMKNFEQEISKYPQYDLLKQEIKDWAGRYYIQRRITHRNQSDKRRRVSMIGE